MDAVTRRDAKVMALIGVAHGNSHFFQLVLPPLFPFFIVEFEASYTELGAMMSLFFVVSAILQPLAGFLVDRIGAKRILTVGLLIYSSAIATFSFLPSLGWFFPVVVLAGIGNCVFHPCDLSILSRSITPGRLGRAFGVHTFGGNLGWAVAPAFILAMTGVVGWRVALLAAAVLGIATALALLVYRRDLHDDVAESTEREPSTRLWAPLLSTPVLLCFFYFALLATAMIGLQNFLPPTLNALHETPLALAGTALTGFLLGASAGVLIGGHFADRSGQHQRIIGGGLAGAAGLILLVSAGPLPAVMLVAVFSAAGLLSGITTPSRDMLVRAAAPSGASGRVFGFVYSGLDAGSAVAPLTIAVLLDHGHAQWVLWLMAAVLGAAILTAVSVRPRAVPA